jgi:hypothetical protein
VPSCTLSRTLNIIGRVIDIDALTSSLSKLTLLLTLQLLCA